MSSAVKAPVPFSLATQITPTNGFRKRTNSYHGQQEVTGYTFSSGRQIDLSRCVYIYNPSSVALVLNSEIGALSCADFKELLDNIWTDYETINQITFHSKYLTNGHLEVISESELCKQKVQVLDLKILNDGDQSQLTASGFKSLWKLSSLTTLTVRNCGHFNNDFINFMTETPIVFEGYFKNLTHLNIEDCHNINDESIFMLNKLCTYFESISLTRCRNVTGIGFKNWGNTPTVLKSLVISDSEISDISFIPHSSYLTTLRLQACPNLTGDAFTHIASLKELEILDLNMLGKKPDSICTRSITYESFKALTTIPSLKKIYLLGRDHLTDMDLVPVETMSNLITLSLGNCPQITNKIVTVLEKLTMLENLSIANTGINTVKAWEIIVNLPSLKNLYIKKGSMPEGVAIPGQLKVTEG